MSLPEQAPCSMGCLKRLPGVQGFPDDFHFYGNVHSKHRQIGNAVPVPLAHCLGLQLRAAVQETAERQARDLLAAQMM